MGRHGTVRHEAPRRPGPPRRSRRIGPTILVLVALLATALQPSPASAAPSSETETETETDDAQLLVDAVYELFLDRAASTSEVERWRPTVEWGDRSALTGALAVSDEWAGTRVDELYRTILGREPDPEGHDHWVERIAAGSTLEQVAAHLYGSDEFFQSRGATVDDFVEALYVELLDRPPDDDGHRFWVEEISNGSTRTAVATSFHDAIESRADRVTALFREVLEREPDPDGHAYWTEQIRSVGDVLLAAFLASSDEFHLRATGNPPPETPRALDTGFGPYATIGDLVLVHPSAGVERVGFHESGHDGSQQADPAADAVRPMTMETRHRGTGSRTAADIVVPPDTEIRSPVTGRVVRSGTYRLYCQYSDDFLVVEPEAQPGWEVTVLHIDGVQVGAGDRVEAGVTTIAPRATVLPFDSQVDRYTAEPSWPHVHVETVDPSIPDEHSGSC